MLARMWRKGNHCTLLVSMSLGAATLENSMEVSQTAKNRTTYDPAIPLLGIHLLFFKRKKTTLNQKDKDTCISMFIVALFIIAKI